MYEHVTAKCVGRHVGACRGTRLIASWLRCAGQHPGPVEYSAHSLVGGEWVEPPWHD